jgi:hypothetical protein
MGYKNKQKHNNKWMGNKKLENLDTKIKSKIKKKFKSTINKI